MALAVTATVDAATAAVVLEVTGASGNIVATANPAGADAYTVRSFWTTSGGTSRTFDGDAPFGVPVSYTVTDSVASASTAAPVTVASDRPVLADATTPTSCARVTVVDQVPNEWQARSVWWDVLGSRAPFASIAPLRYRHGDLVLYCPDRDARAEVLGILAGGVPFTLRTPCGDAVDDVIGLPETIREDLVIASDKAGPRLVTITYQAIARELGAFLGNPGRMYADLHGEVATYALLLSSYARYADVLSGVPK